MTLGAVAYLVPSILLAAVGNVLLRQGMSSLGDEEGKKASLLGTALFALRSWVVWVGMISYVTAMGCWLQVLGRAEIGLAYPIFSGGVTLAIMTGAVVVLGESIERRRVIGALLMIAGIALACLE